MKQALLTLLFALAISMEGRAQVAKVYDETLDPMQQIDKALDKARQSHRHVICQLGGNWCPWCLRFADFITKDSDIVAVIRDNYEYIHVNYPRRDAAQPLKARLHNAGRFGYPVFVVLSPEGEVLHIQDSSFLEEGNSYNKDKVLRFLKGWTPEACTP